MIMKKKEAAAEKKAPARKKKAAGGEGASAAKPVHFSVLKTPSITEKSTMLGDKNKIVFNVSDCATKPQIKEAVEAIFGVKVKSVNTLNRKGKSRGFRGNAGKRSDQKKAVITLVEGQSVDLAAGAK